MAEVKKGGAAAKVVDEKSGATKIAPATDFAPSGAPQQVVPDVDPSHPAVDNDPRASTTVAQNRIDFNDPRKPGSEVVAEQLGMEVEAAKPEAKES